MSQTEPCAGNPATQALPDSTQRFSDRVADYVRYRPGYPDELVRVLEAGAGLRPGSVVADVGSGTGISSDLFLRNGCEVFAVEPNGPMRAAAETWHGANPAFHSVAGSAEDTSLPAASVDLVVAGQAFHWFDGGRARDEFARILREREGYVALFWNSRATDATRFLREYEDLLLEHATDYRRVDHRSIGPDTLGQFFGGAFETRVFPTSQAFDFESLRGRLLSSSYVPAAGDPRHEPMISALRRLFAARQRDGMVHFLYHTEIHFGRLRQNDPL